MLLSFIRVLSAIALMVIFPNVIYGEFTFIGVPWISFMIVFFLNTCAFLIALRLINMNIPFMIKLALVFVFFVSVGSIKRSYNEDEYNIINLYTVERITNE